MFIMRRDSSYQTNAPAHPKIQHLLAETLIFHALLIFLQYTPGCTKCLSGEEVLRTYPDHLGFFGYRTNLIRTFVFEI